MRAFFFSRSIGAPVGSVGGAGFARALVVVGIELVPRRVAKAEEAGSANWMPAKIGDTMLKALGTKYFST